MSVDLLAEKFPNESPYVYAGNNPVVNLDIGGNYKFPAAAKYTKLAGYLQNGMGNLLKNDNIRSGLRLIGGFSDSQINELGKLGGGEITIELSSFEQGSVYGGEINGYSLGKDKIQINEALVQQLQDASTPEEENAALLGVVSTILHETIHAGQDGAGERTTNNNDGPFSRTTTFNTNRGEFNDEYYFNGYQLIDPYGNDNGKKFENAIWNFGGLIDFKKQGEKGKTGQGFRYYLNLMYGDKTSLPKME